MNQLRQHQKTAISRIRHQLRNVTGMCFCTSFFFVSACTDNHPVKDSIAIATEKLDPKKIVPLYTPNSAIGQGQLNALHNFISKKWQLIAINNAPTPHPVVIDLTRFQEGLGQAITDCGIIYFQLDTTEVLAGALSIIKIERTLSDCSHTTQDDIMRILGDLYGFSHKGDTLTLLSLKDELKLTPIQ